MRCMRIFRYGDHFNPIGGIDKLFEVADSVVGRRGTCELCKIYGSMYSAEFTVDFTDEDCQVHGYSAECPSCRDPLYVSQTIYKRLEQAVVAPLLRSNASHASNALWRCACSALNCRAVVQYLPCCRCKHPDPLEPALRPDFKSDEDDEETKPDHAIISTFCEVPKVLLEGSLEYPKLMGLYEVTPTIFNARPVFVRPADGVNIYLFWSGAGWMVHTSTFCLPFYFSV